YHPACIFCNDARDVIHYKGKMICSRCLEELKEKTEQ
ncbi:MAG: AbrB family transcriptional regulator, partial [Clostridiales bacterium]|nr:AbrB family transcriptional regulator [Clostridiales bacterium]